jgi:hypothetical protein
VIKIDEIIYFFNEKISNNLELLKEDVEKNKDEIDKFFLDEVLESKNKEEMLLLFRRGIEMIVKKPFILTTKSLTTGNLIAVRKDNVLQLLDDRYYESFKLSSFVDLFLLETKNLVNGEPHIKLLINYIEGHYNTTFRKFMNRNTEYYNIYKFFFNYGEDIKYVLNILNSYHYTNEIEELYYTDENDIKIKVSSIYNVVKELLGKL